MLLSHLYKNKLINMQAHVSSDLICFLMLITFFRSDLLVLTFQCPFFNSIPKYETTYFDQTSLASRSFCSQFEQCKLKLYVHNLQACM